MVHGKIVFHETGPWCQKVGDRCSRVHSKTIHFSLPPLLLSGSNFFFSKIFFFWCGPFLKSILNFVTVLLMFYALVFLQWGMCDLSSPTRDQTCTHTPALEGEVLTTGLPGKSLGQTFWLDHCCCFLIISLLLSLFPYICTARGLFFFK